MSLVELLIHGSLYRSVYHGKLSSGGTTYSDRDQDEAPH